ncbi:hypothetical protein Tco_0878655 [Tanacetum coccineum]|uniref:Integrase, catalytic region, zinc finger, CCHC-type, peptidase aspartic, catalytic n=1 Tax=Tanacetum coccineum TaxID=301880 RepID=A0ABQ5C3X4_9ASTR
MLSISKKTKSVTVCNNSSNSKTLNVNAVCAECGKCVFNSNHDACVSRYLKDVNARTKKPNVVPISVSKPKRKANKSVATPYKKTVASDITIQKSKSYHKELYDNTTPEWKWKDGVSSNISPTIDIVSRITNVLNISNSIGSNLSNIPSSSNSLGDLNQGNVTIKWVYYVEGLNLNLFSVGQFCDADLEVDFRKSTCFVRDLQGNDLLTGLPKLKYVKDQLYSSCEMSKAKRSSFRTKVIPSSKGRLNLLHMDLCGPMRVASINGKNTSGGIQLPLVKNLVSWMSKKQNCTAMSLAEAEYVALSARLSSSHKVVRLGINPMIQPEPEDLPKDNPKLEIAVLRVPPPITDDCWSLENDIMDPVMQCTTLPSHSGFSQQKLVSFVTEIHTLSIDISFRDC